MAGLLMLAGGVQLLGRRYHLLAQGLLGGGVATLYFSVYAAANFYDLIRPVPTAFALMVLVAALAAVAAAMLDILLMAVLGLLLGLATPMVLHTGVVHFVGLNTYLLALTAGVILVSLWKDWPVLDLLAFFGIYGVVFVSLGNYRPEHYLEVFPFLAGLFVLFSLPAIVRHLHLRQPANLLDLVLLLGNFSVLLLGGGWLTYGWLQFIGQSPRYTALLPAAMLLFYLGQLVYLLHARVRDAGLWAAAASLASLCAAVAPALALGSHWSQWLMPVWAFQGTALFWLGLRLRSRLLSHWGTWLLTASLILFAVVDMPGRVSESIGPGRLGLPEYLLLALERLAPSLLAVLALGTAAWFAKHPPRPAEVALGDESYQPPSVFTPWPTTVVILTVLLVSFGWEADRLLDLFAPVARPLGFTVVWSLLAGVLLAGLHKLPAGQRRIWLRVIAVPLLVKVAVDVVYWEFGPGYAFARGVSPLGSALRLLEFGLIGAMLLLAARLVPPDEDRKKHEPFSYALAALGVLWLTLTLETSTWLHHLLPGFQAGGVSILWALFALGLLLGGILRRLAPLRWLGLGLFAVVAFKVFLVDLRHLDAFYRIVAFVVLGVLVLSGSWLYMRFQERFRENEPAAAAAEAASSQSDAQAG